MAATPSDSSIVELVRTLAIELAPSSVRVDSLAAGAVALAMHNEFLDTLSDEMMAAYRALHLPGFGRPEEGSRCRKLRAIPADRCLPLVAGQNLSVDGGYAAK